MCLCGSLLLPILQVSPGRKRSPEGGVWTEGGVVDLRHEDPDRVVEGVRLWKVPEGLVWTRGSHSATREVS